MVDKNFCMSSYLVFRYIVENDKNFSENMYHQIYELIPENDKVFVCDENDIDRELESQISANRDKKLGILLSGGMDSACLASYMPGCDAYTFRFLNGKYQEDELARAEYYAKQYDLALHYVDIEWDIVEKNVDLVMINKGAPVHSIEPQIFVAAKQALEDGIEMMIIGDAADYVFGGMDGLYSKDWLFEEFVKRYTYLDPKMVLENPVDMTSYFEKYKMSDKIDFVNLMHEYADIESFSSYKNAFDTCGISYLDPYEILKMDEPLDLKRIRSGESKYLIRALFKMKYPNISVPQKIPMPRPVDAYFENWEGPTRPEFKKKLDMSKFTGNQKWQIWCLERFLNNIEK